MCSRVCLSTDLAEISDRFGVYETRAKLRPHWNIGAGQILPTVRLDPLMQRRRLDLMRWGLIPGWARSAVIVRCHLSAWEIDGSLKEMLHHPGRRCLVPVDNFFEWRPTDGQPFAIALANRQLMTLGGIWDMWISPMGERIACFALLTTQANDMMVSLCKEMPVIIQPSDWNLWLGTEYPQDRTVRDLLLPFPDDLLTAWAVSRRVRNARNDDPDLLAAV